MLQLMDTFSDWLVVTLEEKGWSQADLARQAEVSPAAISDIISGRRNVGKNTAKAIAKALKLPPEQVFREAGILPKGKDDNDPWAEEMSHKLKLLSPRVRDMAARIINALAEAEPESNNEPKPKTKSLTP